MKFFNSALLAVGLSAFTLNTYAQDISVVSPDKQLSVNITVTDGKPAYSVTYKGKTMLDKSPLGLTTNEGDFTTGMKYLSNTQGVVDKNYTQDKIKRSQIHYAANKLIYVLENAKQRKLNVEFQVSNNNIAFRYEIEPMGERLSCVVEKEATGFKFPSATTTFLSNNMTPMTGFARTAPSYESAYVADAPMVKPRPATEGYVFPGLFHVGTDGWVLLSETGVSSLYCASHLSEISADGVYSIEYPNVKQNNGFGSTGAAIALPGYTPWRTITVGDNLKPIVETTIPYDVVDPLYKASKIYKYGKGTWSWILWQDNSMNYADQVKFIDLAATLKYDFILMDALWDKNVGKEKMAELVKYAASKKVAVFLWYNSNGQFNDAPQGPRNKMNTSIERKKEMKWLRDIGVVGLKVDFWGGDKQETMRLYEDVLSDANDYGLMIDFHGATLPRGWERMYPNYVGTEAVLASEMVYFNQGNRQTEAVYATFHPFIRNAVGNMEFGGTFLNKYLTKTNKDRSPRLTTDAFELATAVLFQNSVQFFALAPNNLTDVPPFEIDFMKTVPTTWEETLYIDGYPGKSAVIARRSQGRWYIAGANAGKEVLKLKLNLPMIAGKKVQLYNDDSAKATFTKQIDIAKNGELEIEIQPMGGFVIK
ncbi:glycoside hydrolase family 97 catalytic domain-containing protein [Mucilaginibacter calamicampi]|uniref:Glycoside hydrolase family 97 catalytic domain-containing protein n=1 Tax=Mucilaginibacter calamicampi TaxID=1302352 RepID=A0ABW2YSB4_9SPHI